MKKIINKIINFFLSLFKKEEKFDTNYLYDLCKVKEHKNDSSSINGHEVHTPRVKYISQILQDLGINFEIDTWKRTEGLNLHHFNIIAKIPAKKKTDKGVFVVAHHDVNNPNSDNCFDNTASIVNLINLAKHLKKKKPKRNVFIAFTDLEEFGQFGAQRLANQIKEGNYGDIKYVINNELTAKGDAVWVENEGEQNWEINKKINEFNGTIFKKELVPPNDSNSFRRYGLESLCFGILPRDQVEDRFPSIWTVCHSLADKYEDANEEDMKNYVQFLSKII